MKFRQRTRHLGFTIVELLIVIVIIAILAAITIVAYNGIQQRAKTSQDAAAIAQFSRSLFASASQNGKYPIVSGYNCISTDATQLCGNITSTTTACGGIGRATGSTTFISAMQTAGVGLPNFSTQQSACGGANYGGAFYMPSTDGATAQFYYFGPSTQPCPNGSPATLTSSVSGSMNVCVYTLPAASSL